MQVRRVFSGNVVSFRIEYVSELDFRDISRMVASFEGTAIVADTDVDPALVSWSIDGIIELNVGGLGVPAGLRRLTLKAYDGGHPSGQVLVCPGGQQMALKF